MLLRSSLPLIMAACVSIAYAQYRVHSWLNFESGQFPSALSIGHHADSETVYPFAYSNAPNLIPSDAGHQREIGNYGLVFQTDEERRHLTVFDSVSLDRARLGENGRALYQADFYLPAEGEPIPNVTLLAAKMRDNEQVSYSFYRFGILRGGEKVFFSYTDVSSTKPLIYQNQSLSDFNLTRPGWHRFQIVFRGQEAIECAIDGQTTVFSPIMESTHKVLNAGLMITAGGPKAPALVDNLSIQWTNEESPLPISPWDLEASARAETATGSPFDPSYWIADSAQAWRTAQAQKKPILTLFYSPQARPFQQLLKAHPNGVNSQQILANYIPLRLNTNQLAGGQLAEKFNVIRIPSLIIVDSSGKEINRMTYKDGETTWDDIVSFLN